LVKLDVQVLSLGHKLVFTGRDAKDYLKSSLEGADKYVAMAEGFLLTVNGDIEQAAAMVKEAEWASAPSPKQPEYAYMVNTRTRVEKIWERMQN